MTTPATSASVAPLRTAAPRVRSWRALSVVALLAAGALMGACSENLDTGKGCPVLCAGQSLTVRDTVLTPVLAFDSTYTGYPQRGTEGGILLAARGDTIDTRGIVRYDTLPTKFQPTTADTVRPIAKIDSSRLRLMIDTTGRRLPATVTFDVYDVDEPSDTNSAAVLAQFVPSRRIGGLTIAKTAITDSLFIPLSDSAVLNKITSGTHLRVGIKVGGSGSVWMRVGSMETGLPIQLRFRPSTDSGVKAMVIGPLSSAPLDPEELRRDLQDYTLVAKNAMPVTTGTMSVGGVPGRRAYLRFNIPRAISDSTTVLRATLRLTQRPLPLGDKADTIVLHAHVGLAGPQVTDLYRASDIIAGKGLLFSDSLMVTPPDSGLRTLEIYSLVRAWGGQSSLLNAPPRALILRARDEALTPMEIRFFSTSGPAATRPSLRITYVPKSTYGVP